MPTNPMTEVLERIRNAASGPDDASLTDGQLLQNYVHGHEQACLAALVRRHGPMVWGVCRRILDHHDAEDAFQATFLVFVRKAASITAKELLANWLYGVAHQTALKARSTTLKRWTREKQVTEMPEPAATEQSGPEVALWNDLQPLLDQELSRLPDKYRVAIVLCELEGKTRKEAARQLGVPEGTLAARLARGRVMLAKRLGRHGLAVSAGTLAGMFGQHAAACVPAHVMSNTIVVASVFAAGSSATSGLVSAKVATLTEGVLKAMLISKLKVATTLMCVVALVGLGAGAFVVQAKMPGGAAPIFQRDAPEGAEELMSLSARVAAASPDGKTITLELPPEARGEEGKRPVVRIGDQTKITYHGVGLNGAKPTEGYHAQVWLNKGSSDMAAKISFQVLDSTRHSRFFVTGNVVAVSDDAKRVTVELPAAREQEARRIDIMMTGDTKASYAYVAKGAAKPTVGYHADIWLAEGTGDAAKAHFVDVLREQEALVVGKVVDLATERNTITLEVPPRVRGDSPTKTEIKLSLTTEISFHAVGPQEARLTEGYGARVWLLEGSLDTAAKVVLSKANERGR